MDRLSAIYSAKAILRHAIAAKNTHDINRAKAMLSALGVS